MEDRRPYLDLDMYKISEEDSQDEEVLNVMQHKVEIKDTKDRTHLFQLIEDHDDAASVRTEHSGDNSSSHRGKLEEVIEEDCGENENFVPLSTLCSHIPEHFYNAVAILFTTSVKLNKKLARTTAKSGPELGKERSCIDRIKESDVDVVFSWPKKVKSKTVQALLSSLGMFSTIYRLLKDVTGSNPISSLIAVDGELTNISYSSDNDGKSLLIVAIADGILGRANGSLSQLSITKFTARLTQSISFKWGSLTRAFHSTKEKEMGRFLSNAVACLVSSAQDDFLFVNQPRAYPLVPKTILVRLEELLYNLEGSEFSEEATKFTRGLSAFSNDERISDFHCLGSMLLYKGEVASSHLELDVQTQFYTWMMTELSKWERSWHWPRLKRLVLWQPVFLPVDGRKELTGKEDEKSLSRICNYAVLVGLDYFVLGFILEPITASSDKFASPDASWIGKGLQTLVQLARSDINLFFTSGTEVMQQRVEILRNPNITRKNFASSSTSFKKTKVLSQIERESIGNGSKGSSSKPPDTAPLKGSGLQISQGPLRASTNVQNLIDEFEASHIDINGVDQDRNGYGGIDTGPHNGNSDASSSRMSGDGSDTTSLDTQSASQDCPVDMLSTVSITQENNIFEFVHIEYGRGLFVSSTERSIRDEPLPHEDILRNFRKASVLCHAILHKSANCRKKLACRAEDWKWVNKAMSPVSEHGTLFECFLQDGFGTKKKKKPKRVCYWVIGRLYEDHREIYVCIQDTVENHNVLELAFKIAHITDPGSSVRTRSFFT